jgi:hypothetical protein
MVEDSYKKYKRERYGSVIECLLGIHKALGLIPRKGRKKDKNDHQSLPLYCNTHTQSLKCFSGT